MWKFLLTDTCGGRFWWYLIGRKLIFAVILGTNIWNWSKFEFWVVGTDWWIFAGGWKAFVFKCWIGSLLLPWQGLSRSAFSCLSHSLSPLSRLPPWTHLAYWAGGLGVAWQGAGKGEGASRSDQCIRRGLGINTGSLSPLNLLPHPQPRSSALPHSFPILPSSRLLRFSSFLFLISSNYPPSPPLTGHHPHRPLASPPHWHVCPLHVSIFSKIAPRGRISPKNRYANCPPSAFILNLFNNIFITRNFTLLNSNTNLQ